jgi:ring-1,2-phenylacetyl-CoA epoxidase subunit PaaE
VAIKRIDKGRFSTYANTELKVGDKLEVMTPTGSFCLEPNAASEKNYVLFAAGSGITPIISIAKTILENEPNSHVALVYGNRGFSSIIFREELEGLKNIHTDKFQLIHVLSRESLGNPLQKGRISEDKATQVTQALLKGVTIDAVYICGPEEMIHAVKKSMSTLGVADGNIHFELFDSMMSTDSVKKAVVTDAEKVTANVTLILDGDQFHVNLATDGISILDAGIKAGADLPFSCKGGVCCTCKGKIIEGSAVMDINYALEKDEVEAGYILTCQAHPTSEKLVVSYDD